MQPSHSSERAPILTVSQLTQSIKLQLETQFPSVWLQGEVSNCKLQSSGHLYFSLKDAKAQISAVMFRGDIGAAAPIPKDGGHLVVRGELNVYPPNGKYQLIVREMRQVGLGDLLLKLEELKEKLRKRGWFSKEHKKPLPKFPRCIGVVTSPTGAVIQDILHVLSRRFSGFRLILNPVRVQGEGAAQEIARAIQQFNQFALVDVIIVGRGGGSLEDLWAFNEECVAEAIFNSKIPIISAVGHETDHCIADYVADVRAPTPSAAAELVTAEKNHCLVQLQQMQRRLHQTTGHLIRQALHRLEGIRRHPILRSPYTLLGPYIQKIDGMRQDLDETILHLVANRRMALSVKQSQLHSLKPTVQILHRRAFLTQLQGNILQAYQVKVRHWKDRFDSTIMRRQLHANWQRLIQRRQERLAKVSQGIHAINPKQLLSRGYCIPFAEKDNSVITSVSAVAKGERICLLLADGTLRTTVN